MWRENIAWGWMEQAFMLHRRGTPNWWWVNLQKRFPDCSVYLWGEVIKELLHEPLKYEVSLVNKESLSCAYTWSTNNIIRIKQFLHSISHLSSSTTQKTQVCKNNVLGRILRLPKNKFQKKHKTHSMDTGSALENCSVQINEQMKNFREKRQKVSETSKNIILSATFIKILTTKSQFVWGAVSRRDDQELKLG